MDDRIEPNLDDSIRFLDWIGYPLHLVAFTIDQKNQHHCFAQSAEMARDWLEKHEGWNLYFGINEDSRRIAMPEKSEILAVRFFHIDLDPRAGEDLEEERKRAYRLLTENLPSGVPAPSAIIFSGGGYQGLWRLSEPIPLDGNAEDVERYTRWLELQFGTADPVHNVNRIFRVPGTVNWPTAKKVAKGRGPKLAELVELQPSRLYPATDFGRAPAKAAATTVEVVAAPRIGDIEKLRIPDRYKVIAVQGRHPDEPAKDGDDSRSGWLFDFVCGCLRVELDEGSILSVLLDPSVRISESVREKKQPEKYARRQIERAKQRWLGESEQGG